MLNSKEYLKQLKKQYPRKMHKLIKLIVNSRIFFDNISLCEFLNKITNYTPNDIKFLITIFNKYPQLTIELTIENLLPSEIEFYINTFGESLLSKRLTSIIKLDLNNPIIKSLLSQFKNNENLLLEIINNTSEIEKITNDNIPTNLVINNLRRAFDLAYKGYDVFKTTKLLELNEKDYLNFKEWEPLYHKIPYRFQNFIFKFLLNNPQYFEIFIKFQSENLNFNLIHLIRNAQNENLYESLFISMLSSDLSFDIKKNFLMSKLFYTDLTRINLTDMLTNKNNNYNYPDEINNYLELYETLLNTTNEQELFDFYKKTKTQSLFSLEEIKTKIIVEYNKKLNSILTKNNEIENNSKVTFTEEEYTSKIYSENGNFIKNKISIYTLHNLEFYSIMHGLVEKADNNYFKQLHAYTKDLYKRPDLWTSSPEFGTKYISTSLNSHESIALFGIPKILFGINEISNTQIKKTTLRDNATDMKPGTDIENSINLIQPEILTLPATKSVRPKGHYNECISSRDGIIPNYLIVANSANLANIPLLTDETKELALFYKIPIYVIDCKSYYEYYYKKFIEYKDKIIKSKRIPSNEEINHLFYLISTANQYSPLIIGNTFDILASLIDLDYKDLTEEDIQNLENIVYNRISDFIKDIYGSTYLENSYDIENIDYTKAEELLKSRTQFVENLKILIAERKGTISRA